MLNLCYAGNIIIFFRKTELAEPPRVVHIPPADVSQTVQSALPEDTVKSESIQKSSEPANAATNQGHRDTKEGVWLKLANRIKNLEKNA